MTELITAKDNLKATQDNQLIEACYSMTLNEKRLLLFGISKINPSTFPDVNKPFKFEMTAQEWKEQFGDDNPWRALQRSAKLPAQEELDGPILDMSADSELIAPDAADEAPWDSPQQEQ